MALHEQVARAPSRRALAFIDTQGRFSWRSLEEVYDRASSYSAALLERRLRPGDVCVLALPTTESCATLLVATLLLGAVPLLVTPPALSGRESFLTALLRFLMRKTGARLVIVPAMAANSEEILPGSRQSRLVIRETDLAPLAGTRVPRIAPAETAAAVLQPTTGSARLRRVCVWTHAGITAALDGMTRAMRLGESDVCLTWTPLYHDVGLSNNLLLCLTRGIPLALLSPTDFLRKPALWLRGLSDTGSTVTWSPNFGFALATRKIGDEELEGVRLDHVRAFWNAAERVHLDTLETFHRRFAPVGVRLETLKTTYGCPENVGGATFSDPARRFTVERVDKELLRKRGVARPLPDSAGDHASVSVVGVGRPYPGLQVRILSRVGRPLPDGRVGEVVLETPSPMKEYLGHARDTRRTLRGGVLRTGDLGYLRSGELFWVDHLRDLIVVGERKLDPSDFTRVLSKVPGLRHGHFTAFGVDDPQHGTHRVVVAVEVHDAALDPDKLAASVREEVHAQLGVTVDDLLLLQPGTLSQPPRNRRRHHVARRLYLSGGLHASALMS